MTRSHFALALLLLTQGTLFLAFARAPASKKTDVGFPPAPDGPSDARVYFPSTVGAKQLYRVTKYSSRRKERPYDVVIVVTAVEEREGRQIVTCRELEGDGNPYPVREWELSKDGLRRRRLDRDIALRSGRVREFPWHTVLRNPVRPGDSWRENWPEDDAREEVTIRGWEYVNVKAGVFQALRVDIVLTPTRGTDKVINATAWYAPNVGLIRLEAMCHGPLFSFVDELVEFRTGG